MAEGEGTVADWNSLRLTWEPRLLSILRIMTGLLFLQFGLNKLFNFPPTQNHVPYDLFTLVPGLAGLLETFGGILIVFGLFTRPVAFILSGEMAFAYFMAHAPRGFFPAQNAGTAAILFCFIFLYLWLAGGGEWSLDRLLAKEPAAREMPYAETHFVGEPWAVRRVSAAAPENRAALRVETAISGPPAGSGDRAAGRDRGGQPPRSTEGF
jgi:putative oxidoreductase